MTPLFPNDNENILIKQGQTGDCYLLASLDCIFNLGKEGRDKFKSLFTQKADGVELRIKHNRHSEYLKDKSIAPKYVYHYDHNTDEDCFFIPNKELDRIDKTKDGVWSNSLAVKILEHISSYYFVYRFDQEDMQASVLAHNEDQRYSGSPTQFVADLLDCHAYDTREYDDIIKLKTILPALPVYISMKYGKADELGKIHTYHALRIKQIIPKGNSYDFVLANPWNNSKEETFSLEDIKERNYKFSIFDLKQEKLDLMLSLIRCDVPLARYALNEPKLQTLLVKLREIQNSQLKKYQLEHCIQLYQTMTYLPELFNSLCVLEQPSMFRRIQQSQGNAEEFLKLMITRFPRMSTIRFILEHDNNGQTLGKVLVSLASSVQRQPHNVLNGLFINPDFFKTVVEAAVKHRAAHLGKALPAEAQRQVEADLISYYFLGDSLLLTRQAGLRSLFEQNIFTDNNIHAFFKPEILLTSAIARVIDKGIITAKLLNYIARDHGVLINAAFLNQVIDECSDKEPRQLFEGLHALSKENIPLAHKLFTLLVEKTTRNPGAFKKIAESIALEPASEFKEWFAKMKQPFLPIPVEAVRNRNPTQEVIKTYRDKINSFPVLPNDKRSADEVHEQWSGQLKELEQLRQEATLVKAEGDLGYFSHPLIQESYILKIKQINAVAYQQLDKISRAHEIIQNIVGQIERLTFKYLITSARRLIISQRELFIKQLEQFKNGMKDSPQWQEAHNILGLDAIHPEIAAALNSKRGDIVKEAGFFLDVVDRAQLKINEYIAKLEAFEVPTNNGRSKTEIQQQRQRLLTCFNEMCLNEDLIKALFTLEINNLAEYPLLNALIDSKINLIDQNAKQQQAQIEHAEQIIESCLELIEEMPVQFTGLNTRADVEAQHKDFLIRLENIVRNKKDLVQAQEILGVPKGHPEIVSALQRKQQAIKRAATQYIYSLKDAAIAVIKHHAKSINNVPVGIFNQTRTLKEVEKKKQELLLQIESDASNDSDLRLAKQQLGIKQLHHPVIAEALRAKAEIIRAEAKAAENKINSYYEAQVVLGQINFTGQLAKIQTLTGVLEDSFKKYPNYEEAVNAAKVLYSQLDNSRHAFLNSSRPIAQSTQDFKESCLTAIHAANSVLKTHRGWKEVLFDIASVVISIVTAGFANYLANRWRLFPATTNSAQTTQEVEAAFHDITVDDQLTEKNRLPLKQVT